MVRAGTVDDHEPVAWEYGEARGWVLRYEMQGEMEGWRRVFDDLHPRDIEWRPYRSRQFRGWTDTRRQEGYFLSRCFIIGTLSRIVESHQPDRVLRQFGVIQDIPAAPIMFRRYSREIPWGGCIAPSTTRASWMAAGHVPYPGRVGGEQVPVVTERYRRWF